MKTTYEDTRLAVEKYLNISNNDSGMKKIAHLYEGLEDQVIDFEGKAMIYDEPVVPFVLQHCKNLTIKNCSIDFKTPFYLQGQVVAIDEEEGVFDLQILDECVYVIRGDKLYFRGKALGYKWQGIGSEPAPCTRDMTWEQNFVWNMWFREDGSTPEEESSYYLLAGYTCEEITPGIVRFYQGVNRMPMMGWQIVIKGKQEQNRRYPAIFVEHCENITFENVTVHHSSGMALIAQRSETITMRNYKVALPTNSQRVCTSTADGSHFSGCRGKITMENCYFENMLDDALNVHGIFVIVDEVMNDFTVRCKYGHSQQVAVPFADEGDDIRAYIASDIGLVGEARVEGVNVLNSLYFELVFDEAITDMIEAGMVLDNKTWQPEILVTDTTVKNNRARTLLLQSEKLCVIENNVFEAPSMNCLQFSGDPVFWYEAGYVNNVIIRNNVFKNVRDYVVKVCVEVANDTDMQYHHNIKMIGNEIHSAHGRLLDLSYVDGFEFTNNSLYIDPDLIDEATYKHKYCRHIVIENNPVKEVVK